MQKARNSPVSAIGIALGSIREVQCSFSLVLFSFGCTIVGTLIVKANSTDKTDNADKTVNIMVKSVARKNT